VSETASYDWDAGRVRALRSHLGVSQQQLADRLGTRQQTVSEWETASSSPRRMSRRLLTLVAEEAGFYDAASNGERSAEGGAR
jgi:putative transcriptional regulator